jgi:glycosyltransferase involved in cell wall biosynthesis
VSERRLLVLQYFYPPLAGGGVHRVLGFTRHLPRHGWRCTVVCAAPGDYWVSDASLERLVPPETEVIRVAGGSALSAWLKLGRGRGAASAQAGARSGRTFAGLRALSDFWLLPDSYVGWAKRARAAAARRIARGGIDALLSSSPPDSVHLAARPLARRFGLPWVADFRDPWVSLHLRRPPTGWHRARHEALERAVLAESDVVLTASRTHADRIAPAAAKRVVHLPNGYEPDTTPSAPRAGAADHFRIVFTGTLSQMPDTGVLLDALHEFLAHRPEARRRLRVTLAGPFDTGYQDRAIALGLTPGIVDFPGPLAHAGTRALQRAADLLLLWKPHAMPTMVPGKLYEYLETGRPLVALLEENDEAAALVRRAGGTVIAPGARAALGAEIERRYTRWREAGAEAASPAPPWLAEHTRERLAGRLAEVLDTLVAGASSGDTRDATRSAR